MRPMDHLEQHQQQPQQQQQQKAYSLSLTPWMKSTKTLELKKKNSPIKTKPQEPEIPLSPIEPKQLILEHPLSSPQQQLQEQKLYEGSVREVTQEERQEQATQLIASNMRRKSTLPVYPSLERFEIIKKLGDGAFSDVYRARDKRTGRNVAIKVAQKYASDGSMVDLQHLHPSMKKKPRVTERANILKEVQIMRNIRHPNIVQLIQFTESRENYFLVLELCEGGELFHRIVDLTYLSEDLSRHVIGQLAQAVYHLHEECGVVHRDIKPENILFDPIPIIPSEQRKFHVFDDQSKKDEGVFIKDVGGGGIGQVKLADFGLSKIIWDKDTLTPCGTVGYTAPEIVKDQRYSKGVDCWAMGCVLFTMLCGFPPFYDESISALTRKVARGEFSFLSPWWDPISDEAKDLIQGLLCVDPRKRYTVRQVLQHPWLTGKKLISSQSGGPSFVDECESIRIQAMRKAAASSTIKSTDSPHNIDSIDNQQTTSHISSTSDLTSTTSSTGRKDVFSPGMATLKEILDITAAVQRMTEEHTNHGEMITDDHEDQQRQYHHNIKTKEKQLYNAQAAAHHQQGLAKIKKTAVTPIVMATGTIHTTNGQRRHQPGFDLNMNNATLLKNRRMKHLVMPCQ